ncbi:MAG: hypothetical protein HYY52_05645 [Candidatus Melainabacteria bacterium]|nr:hypothetical protein [Candidatus Melainabacteria bacterium]
MYSVSLMTHNMLPSLAVGQAQKKEEGKPKPSGILKPTPDSYTIFSKSTTDKFKSRAETTSETKEQITNLNEAKKELERIHISFQDAADRYGRYEEFWSFLKSCENATHERAPLDPSVLELIAAALALKEYQINGLDTSDIVSSLRKLTPKLRELKGESEPGKTIFTIIHREGTWRGNLHYAVTTSKNGNIRVIPRRVLVDNDILGYSFESAEQIDFTNDMQNNVQNWQDFDIALRKVLSRKNEGIEFKFSPSGKTIIIVE